MAQQVIRLASAFPPVSRSKKIIRLAHLLCVPCCVQYELPDGIVHLDETEEQIRLEFNGMVKRLSAGKAFMVYWRAGG